MELELINKIHYYNPWVRGDQYDIGIPRKGYLSTIMPFMSGEETIAISGIRRCGKSTILLQIIKELLNFHPTDQILLLQADDELISEYVKERGIIFVIEEYLKSRRKELTRLEKPLILFIDEAQDIEDWETKFKNLMDMRKKVKIVVTGSSSAKIKSDALKKLVGRILFFEVHPLSLEEFVFFRTATEIPSLSDLEQLDSIIEQKQLHDELLSNNLSTYLQRGGLPRVAREEDNVVIGKILRDYIDLIIKRDIVSFFTIDHAKDLEEICVFLAKNTGSRLSFTNISQVVGLKLDTVKRYYHCLEQAYLVDGCPFYGARLKKSRKSYKFYFGDLGLRGVLSGQFGLHPSQTELGAVIESYVASILKRSYELHHYYDKYGNEVDFVVEGKSNLIPIEVKYRSNISVADLKGCLSFCRRKKIEDAVVITKDKLDRMAVGNVVFHLVPVHYL